MLRSFHVDEYDKELLRETLVTTGFFYLRHPLAESDLLRSVYRQSEQFFRLDEDEKMKVKQNQISRGYTPFRAEICNPKEQKIGDTKEGYYIGREVAITNAAKMEGPNVFPDHHLLPGWREVMMEYHHAMTTLGYQIARMIAEALNLPKSQDGADFFFAPHLREPLALLRLLHYSAEISNPSDGIYGCGAHSDYGLITILSNDGVAGLQVRMDGEWKDVPSRPGCFIINTGAMLERWCNNTVPATLHRVVSTSGKERYSVVFFYEPSFDAIVEPISIFGSPLYPPIKSGDFLISKYKETHV